MKKENTAMNKANKAPIRKPMPKSEKAVHNKNEIRQPY